MSAPTITGRSLADYLAELQATSDRTRGDVRPSAHDGTPYRVWRAAEHRFYNLREWERIVSERPLGSGPADPTREWDWRGGRVEYRGCDWSLMSKDVGPHDLSRYDYVRPVSEPSPAVHITFPDWVS